MKTQIRMFAGAAAVLAATTSLAGCGGSNNSSAPKSGTASVVSDGTFTMAIDTDPGSLDPQSAIIAQLRQISNFLYDSLVSYKDGQPEPELATKWNETATAVTFTLKQGVTCSDGSPLTAADVAANVNYVADPKNKSALLGFAVPAGAKATADATANTVTVKMGQPTGFLTYMLSNLPIICSKGLADRSMLEHGSDGTGPYTLTDSVSGDHYTFTRRDGYTWGPGGASTATAGVPKTVTVKIVANETTAASLLLSGSLNAATVAGSDVSRLKAAGLLTKPYTNIWGEFFYNQGSDHAGSSPAVRKGLTQALDQKQLLSVSTSGTGMAPKQLIGESPCTNGDLDAQAIPQDISAATQALSGLAGKTLTLLYPSTMGTEASAAAQLAVSEWKAAGVTVEPKGVSKTDIVNALFKTGDYDIVWFPGDGMLPQQVQGLVSGPTPAAGGSNFAQINNATYNDLAAKAAQAQGVSGCDDWSKAEDALVQDADVVPFSAKNLPLWGAGATFDTNLAAVVPTSIRMTK